MQVFLLATDETDKLRPLTERLPGPLVPIVDRPVMARVLELLARNSLKQAWVGLYRLPGEIDRCFGDGRRWGVRLDYVLQREPLGSAGALKWAQRALARSAASVSVQGEATQGVETQGPLLVLPADVILELDIAAAEAYHRQHGGLVTAIVAPVAKGDIALDPQRGPLQEAMAPENPDPLPAPVVWICDNLSAAQRGGPICALDEAGSAGVGDRQGSSTWIGGTAQYTLTGAYIMEPEVLDLIPPRTHFDCARDLLPRLLDNAQSEGAPSLWGYVHGHYWNALTTFAELREAQRAYLHSAWANVAGGAAAQGVAGDLGDGRPLQREQESGRAEEQAGAAQAETAAKTTVAAVATAVHDAVAVDAGHASALEEPRVRYPSLAGLQIAPGIWAGRNLTIHPSALLAPPVYLGDNCQVGREAELGPLAVLGPNVIVDDEATVRESVVLAHTYVGRLVNVVGRVVDRTCTIDAATGANMGIVDPFLLAETTPAMLIAGLGRMADIAGATFLLGLLAPVILLAGLAALLSSLAAGEGPRIIARQPCLGRLSRADTDRGQPANEPRRFGMLYLATRRADGEYTPLGRFLERSELDRLPGLWNVLRGELRLVGVQPLTEDDAAKSVEDWQKKRFTYPAGFTGLWYTQTPREADADTVAVTDAYYVATRTWRHDLRILWRTPSAWARRLAQGRLPWAQPRR